MSAYDEIMLDTLRRVEKALVESPCVRNLKDVESLLQSEAVKQSTRMKYVRIKGLPAADAQKDRNLSLRALCPD
jgi:hypothetical protein